MPDLRQVVELVEAVDWAHSCDYCKAEERPGVHYCLLHGIEVKDMDRTTCAEWVGREKISSARGT